MSLNTVLSAALLLFTAPSLFGAEEVNVEGKKITFVRAQGTYMSGMPGAGERTPLPNHVLLGAILENPKVHVYVRLIAPVDLAEASEKAFREMITSATVEK